MLKSSYLILSERLKMFRVYILELVIIYTLTFKLLTGIFKHG
jgi:hypothetical protein